MQRLLLFIIRLHLFACSGDAARDKFLSNNSLPVEFIDSMKIDEKGLLYFEGLSLKDDDDR